MEFKLRYAFAFAFIGALLAVLIMWAGNSSTGGSFSMQPDRYQNVATSGAMAVTSSAQILATSTKRGYAIICNSVYCI